MKKIMALGLSALLVGSAVCASGCAKKVANGDQDLEVYIVNKGYGYQWCVDILEEFKNQDWVKEKYPNLNITYTYNDNRTFAQSKLSAPKNNTFDLLFGIDGLQGAAAKDGPIVDLTEIVYNQKVPGEDILFKDKLDPSYMESCAYYETAKSPAQYYFIPWAGGMTGICYNKTILDACGVTELPVTTDEFIEACAKIKANPTASGNESGYAIIQSSEAGYFNDLFWPLWAQYDGVEKWKNFYSGLYIDEYGATSYSNKIFDDNELGTNGRVEALKFFEDVLDYDKGYLSLDSFRDNFMKSQTNLIAGKYAFHVNGDWFDNEMAKTREDMKASGQAVSDIRMMKIPIISSIKDVLPDKSVENDAELRALIKAMDAGATALSGTGYDVTQDDFDRVKEARSVVYSIGAGHAGVIPTVSTAQGVAVDFLLFMATDIAFETYAKATGGSTLPFKYAFNEQSPLYSELTPFHQDRLLYFSDGTYDVYTLPDMDNKPMVRYGNLVPLTNYGAIYSTFSASGNTKTPKDFNDETKANWNDGAFKLAMELAGLA